MAVVTVWVGYFAAAANIHTPNAVSACSRFHLKFNLPFFFLVSFLCEMKKERKKEKIIAEWIHFSSLGLRFYVTQNSSASVSVFLLIPGAFEFDDGNMLKTEIKCNCNLCIISLHGLACAIQNSQRIIWRHTFYGRRNEICAATKWILSIYKFHGKKITMRSPPMVVDGGV